MTIEEIIFERKRFSENLLIKYGFKRKENEYIYETEFLNSDFKALICITDDFKLSGRVIDLMNDEEYTLLKNPNSNGSFVNSVRFHYEEILKDIADNCCFDVLFSNDQSNRLTRLVSLKYDIEPDFPFSDEKNLGAGVFRHKDNNKWFALIMDIKMSLLTKNDNDLKVDVINLKTDPEEIENTLSVNGIYPGYHMNHKHWISIVLDDTLSDKEIMDYIAKSYNLTIRIKKKGTDKKQ